MKNIGDRRAFLHALGISVPIYGMLSAGDATPIGKDLPGPARPAPRDPRDPIIRPDEVFLIYVSEALSHLPEWVAKDAHSNVRMLIEAQGAGLAAVIMEMERRQ
jgi:hypothetical protein